MVQHSGIGGEEMILVGIGVSPGIAHGPIHLSLDVFERPEVEDIPADEVESEVIRLKSALETTRRQLEIMRDRIAQEIGGTDADIFDAHLLMLEDRSVLDKVFKQLNSRPQRAEGAFYGVMSKYVETLKRIGDEYLRERTVDIEDVARRVVRNLRGLDPEHSPAQPHILLSPEITPSDTAMMDRKTVLGFATEGGSHTSHSAIMARSMGIPAVVGLPDITTRFHTGQDALLDGYGGLLIVNPTEETLSIYSATRRRKAALASHLRSMVSLPAETLDGMRIVLSANIEFESEMAAVGEWGAEGVGLYRTEFFFLNRTALPTEDEQAENYARVAAAAGPDGVIIRTLDIGGDKLHALHDGLAEANPFLGWRGIRVSLSRRKIFKTQLRAILRASAVGKVRIMFPMVSCREELQDAREILAGCKDDLRAAGVVFDENIEVGAMIEVPSAAITADTLAQEVDFFSIGTNDLIQYTIAVDRGNELVASLYQPCHPAILRLLKHVTDSARNAGIWTGVCGEMAGDIMLTPLMVGLGFTELSMAVSQLPLVKYAIRKLPAGHCADLVAEALKLGDASKIYVRCREVAMQYYSELLVH
ncbi:MAG: phosphoenolpyruvate--protein phosphotransferase [Verrucomicrobiaceae bacterium]|nr:MAG: phosphoenolpyruvate--protein phosphotransferase [Verrucomicrobiaceae bacterium]